MIHAVIGSRGSRQWACGVFETRRRALSYLRKVSPQQPAKLFVLSIQVLSLPIYIIQSPNGLLFAPWGKVARYVKPGVTIFQAINAFQSDRPGVDDMRQTVGLALADIEKGNLKTVPDLMRFWRRQEEGYAVLNTLARAEKRRFQARKRRAAFRGLQQMREGNVLPDDQADARLREIVDVQYDRDSEKLAIIDESLAEIEAGEPGIPHDELLQWLDEAARKRFRT